MHDVCLKCKKRKSCKVPCRPVELYLAEDNLTVFEKNQIGNHGEKISMVFPRSREQHRGSLSQGTDKKGDPRLSSKESEAFSTENENPFRGYEPHFKQTSIFIKRFFFGWSYEDIAQAHDVSVDAARKIYYAGAQKLLAVIVEMDAVKKMTPEERKKAAVAKQKRYLKKNREKVKAQRRVHYQKNKERINAKRRDDYLKKKARSRL